VQQGLVGKLLSKQTGGQQGSGFGQHFGLHRVGGHLFVEQGAGAHFFGGHTGLHGFGQQSALGLGQALGGPRYSRASAPCAKSSVAAAKIHNFITLSNVVFYTDGIPSSIKQIL
jgi:hypothetical protein